MVSDINMFIIGRFSQASYIPVMQYLPYDNIANFPAPVDLLQNREERNSNSDLCRKTLQQSALRAT